MNFQVVGYLLLLHTIAVHGRSAQEWKSRVIYQVTKVNVVCLYSGQNYQLAVCPLTLSSQLLTDRFSLEKDSSLPCFDLSNYCGGTFKGIGTRLDYIQGLGVNAIWISPIPKQTDKGYHGYWQQDITQINPNFGSPADLKELVTECHKRDIWVMVDV